jgi:hypothetical protein
MVLLSTNGRHFSNLSQKIHYQINERQNEKYSFMQEHKMKEKRKDMFYWYA